MFVYGSLRPDDNSGQPWTKEACEGMDWIKAEVHGIGLYEDEYAAAVLGKKGMKVVGCILSCKDPKMWKEKLQEYDYIEGYDERQHRSENFYQRDKVTAKIVESGDEVEVWMYHNPDAYQGIVVPDGDWLQRK